MCDADVGHGCRSRLSLLPPAGPVKLPLCVRWYCICTCLRQQGGKLSGPDALCTRLSLTPFCRVELDEDIPGLGKFFCIACSRYFTNEKAQADHERSKVKSVEPVAHDLVRACRPRPCSMSYELRWLRRCCRCRRVC